MIERILYCPEHKEIGRKIKLSNEMHCSFTQRHNLIGHILLPYGHLVIGAGSSLAENQPIALPSSGGRRESARIPWQKERGQAFFLNNRNSPYPLT